MSRGKKTASWISWLLIVSCLPGCQRKVVDAWSVDIDNARQIRDVVEPGAGSQATVVVTKEPTGFATLRGVVQLNRAVSVPDGPLAFGDDARLCSPNGQPLRYTALQMGADNGLGNVAIWLTKPRKIPEDPKWIHEQYQATRDAVLTGKDAFNQKACVFLSPMFAMRSTQKVEILNSDSMLHNTKIEGDPGGGAAGFNSGISPGGKLSYEPIGYSHRPFRVSCSIHGWMKSYMLVRPNPFFAVSDTDGKFEIAHLPAGIDMEFRVSHEGTFFGADVKATRNGDPLAIKSGRLKLSGIEPNDVIELKFVLDAKNYE